MYVNRLGSSWGSCLGFFPRWDKQRSPHPTTIQVKMDLTIEVLSNTLEFHLISFSAVQKDTLNSITLAKITSNNKHAHRLVVEVIPIVSQVVFGWALGMHW